jgi:uncharacterized membrane protein
MGAIAGKLAAGMRRVHWPILAILIVAAALRIFRIGEENYWFDELQSMESSAGRGWVDQSLPRDTILERPQRPGSLSSAAPWWRIAPAMRQLEVTPPLYFIILRFWRDAFGDAEATTRSLSAIASISAVGLMYAIACNLYGDAAALWAATLMAIAPTQIEFAHEARTYALTTALLLGALLSVLGLRRKGSAAGAIALGACLLCGMLSHYFAAGPALAICIYAAVYLRGSSRRWALGAIAAAAFVYLAIWGPSMLAQRASFHRDLGTVLDITGQSSWPARIATAIVSQVSKHTPESRPLTVVLILTLLAALALHPRDRKSLIAPLWLICGIGLLIVIDIIGGSSTLTVVRYGTLFAPGLFLILAGAIAGAGSAWRIIVPLIFAAACVFHLHDAYMPWKGQWLAAARLIVQHPQPRDIVVIASKQSRSWWLGRSFLGISWYGAGADDRFPLDVVMLTQAPHGDVLARLHSARRFWIITHSTEDGPDFAVPGVKIESQAFIPDVFMLFRVRWEDAGK